MAAVIVAVWAGVFVQKTRQPHHPTDGIPFYYDPEQGSSANESLNEISHLEGLLKTTIIADIDFQELPLNEAVESLFAKINYGRPTKEHAHYSYSDDITNEHMQTPIILRLSNVPAVEGLRYTTSLAQLKYDVLDDNEVAIMGLSQHDPTIVRVKFPTPIPLTSQTGPGPFDVTDELTRFGVSFHDGGYADYYPDRSIVVVAATKSQLEIAAAYFSGACIIYEPTNLQKIRDNISEFFRPISPPPPPPPPGPVDPFASPITLTPSSPFPDPFSPAQSDVSEPDPFSR